MEEGGKKNYFDRSWYFSFYCIRCLTTVILIGKKFIYTNKLNLIKEILDWLENKGPLWYFALNASENQRVRNGVWNRTI